MVHDALVDSSRDGSALANVSNTFAHGQTSFGLLVRFALGPTHDFECSRIVIWNTDTRAINTKKLVSMAIPNL